MLQRFSLTILFNPPWFNPFGKYHDFSALGTVWSIMIFPFFLEYGA